MSQKTTTSNEEEKAITKEIEEDDEEEHEEAHQQLDGAQRELRDVENAIHQAVIKAAKRTGRVESIQRKTSRRRGSTERFRERTRILREVQLSERKWHLFWALLLCFAACFIFVGLLSWIIVAYTGAWEEERKRETNIRALQE